MGYTREELLRFVADEKIVFVDHKFIDLFGRLRHITIPGARFSERSFVEGVGIDGSSVPGFTRLESGDVSLIPDPATAVLDPFTDEPTVEVLCSIHEAGGSREVFPHDPRGVASRAMDFMKSTGIADESRWGPEFEFHVFDKVWCVNKDYEMGYGVDAAEAHWNLALDSEANKGYQIPRQDGYLIAPPHDLLAPLRGEIVKLIEAAGIPAHYHHHEVGGPGQLEIEISRAGLLESGDRIVRIKHFIRMAARAVSKTVTFMPKPLYNEAGNGMHFHQHLFKNGEPLFFDADRYAGLSELAFSYIAGILSHGRALLALTNPSTNSYKRLVPGFEAPVNLFFGTANRSAAIRIPKYATRPEEKRIEFRPPDATCNPYLALSAMLMAGLDGVKKGLDPTAEGFGPYDERAEQVIERGVELVAVPASLEEALEALEEDHDFLLEGGVFTKELIAAWIGYKREREVEEINRRPHPFEVAMYFDA